MFDLEVLHRSKILLVDDDATSLQILQVILKRDGYHNVTALDDPTRVALEYGQHAYDLIALDIHMPVMNGFDVMAALSDSFAGEFIPIVVLTADEDHYTRDLALASGARDFIQKPFNHREVLLRFRNLLETVHLQKALRHQNELLEEKVQQRTRQLHYSQVKLIECLGRAAEFKDNETGAHVMRISKMTGIVARALGLQPRDVELVEQASPMHDIGKIGIPDRVLLKPGKLEGEEWSTMQTHVSLGAHILSGDHNDSELLRVAAEIALNHHERWDGTGYPNGLKGEEIPLFTRITSVCDVFDALTSRRPYKAPWPVEEAIKFIDDQGGRAFDPTIVACFKSQLHKLLAVKEAFPDLDSVGVVPQLYPKQSESLTDKHH
ncbi:MAG: two-component system response regulator [Pseudomonadales bacterium]|nr:two-component system response regulator [Pseudomonadales bacterium]HAG93074.1 two-component system response regulator [Gammaproteobacteria bacterium]HBO94742.1 two-component system response regulator [Gammaproteobacteria bacterium]HCB38552.1 two-component system response regulator [Gammaproteobacteria bacterium]|tara:strand:+ start:3494 stop:4627 length:1134 start_codon:yes stop_codon:yes gene_type:complete